MLAHSHSLLTKTQNNLLVKRDNVKTEEEKQTCDQPTAASGCPQVIPHSTQPLPRASTPDIIADCTIASLIVTPYVF